MAHFYDEIRDFSGRVYSFSENENFIDGNAPIIWDKKRFSFEKCVDLKDLAIFFKIKEFSELHNLFPDEFYEFENEQRRLNSWIKTFDQMNEQHLQKFPLVPDRISHNFLLSRNVLFHSFWDWMKDGYKFDQIISFYRQNFRSFDCVRRMNYQIKTKNGMELVDLSFAENFRFKSNPSSLNLFHMPKNHRDCIIPQFADDFIYVVDFRQFEFRTFLKIVDADVDFDEKDLYGDIGKKIGISREDAKIQIISYLYSEQSNQKFDTCVNKMHLLSKIDDDLFLWDEVPIYVGELERNKQIHTVIQTISYFYYLGKLALVLDALDGKKSRFMFPLHDSMIFSINKNELELLDEIPLILENDTYKIKQYIGKNFLEIEEI